MTLPRPLGVAILAALDVMVGIVLVIIGLVLVVVGAAVQSSPAAQAEPSVALVLGLVGAFGGFAVAFGGTSVVIGWGLWQGGEWARMLTFVGSALGLVASFVALPFDPTPEGFAGNVVSILVGAFLIWYLTRPGVARWFARTGPTMPDLPFYTAPRPPA